MKVLSVAFLILLVAAAAHGHMREVDISEVAVISSEEEGFRVLFKLGDLGIPDTCRIDFATIILPRTDCSHDFAFEVCALTRPWTSSTVSWTDPWDNDGGDFSDTWFTSWVVHPGVAGPGHFIDLTEYIRSVHSGASDYGLIIKPAGDGRAGLSWRTQQVFSGLSGLPLRVLYRDRE